MTAVNDTVATQWKFDVVQATKALDDLKKAITGTGTAAKEAEEEQKSWLHGATEGFREAWESAAKFGEQLFFAVEGAKKLEEGLKKVLETAKFAAEFDNMTAKLPTGQLERFREATEGTVDDLSLLKIGMKNLYGDLQLTGDGMEVVLRAAQHLHDQGFGELIEIQGKLMDSLFKGSSRELKQFNIALADTSDKTANVNAEMRKFVEIAGTEMNVAPALSAVERLNASFVNLGNSIRRASGNALIDAATAANATGDLMHLKLEGEARGQEAEQAYKARFGQSFGHWYVGREGEVQIASGGNQFANDDFRALLDSLAAQRARDKEIAGSQEDIGLQLNKLILKSNFEKPDKPDKLGRGAGAMQLTAIQQLVAGLGQMSGGEGQGGWGGGVLNQFSGGFGLGPGFGGLSGESGGGNGWGIGPASSGVGDAEFPTGQDNGFSFFESAFGPGEKGIAQIDKLKSAISGGAFQKGENGEDQFSAVGASFQTFTSGISAAVDAAITGSDSVGKAFMKASAAALRSLAVESSVRAAYNLAMGIGAAVVAPEAAAGYFAAAAQFTAAAALAGGGSALLGGGGGGGGSSSAGAGAYVTPTAGTTGFQGNNLTVYVGDGFVGRPDELAVAIADKLNHGVSSGRVKTIMTGRPGAVTVK